MAHSPIRWLPTVVAVGLLARVALGAPVTIGPVPWYPNEKGCAPTAGGMVLGFWDANGFPNFIAGSNDWATNAAAIRNMIASPEHIADYWGTDAPSPHADNCLADFMDTSLDPFDDGWTPYGNIDEGLEGYAAFVGYGASVATNTTYFDWGNDAYWDAYRAEIDAGRPVELHVDSDGNGTPEHCVAGYGYDPDTKEYLFLDPNSAGAKQALFTGLADGQAFGLRGATAFNPVPEPLTLTLVAAGAAALVLRRGRTGTQSGRGPRPAARRGPEGTNGTGLRRRTKGNGDRA